MTRFTLAVLLSGLAGAQNIDQLGFMSGCWAFTAGERQVEEFWIKPAGGTMMGVGRTVAGGKATFTEYYQIRNLDGVLTMIVQLKLAATTTPFRLTKVSPNEAVFSSDLEYPARLIYRRQKDGSLFARAEGTQGGKEKSEDFPYRKVTCE
jgi:hypothetical protein